MCVCVFRQVLLKLYRPRMPFWPFKAIFFFSFESLTLGAKTYSHSKFLGKEILHTLYNDGNIEFLFN